MKTFKVIALTLVLLPLRMAFAVDTQCGPFLLSPGSDGLMRINNAKPETQKLTFLKEKEDYRNIKMQWMVPTNSPGKWYGMDYVKKNGKAILNVQLVQANMNAPRVYGTYDCIKVN
ncbi:TPA: hypothetical protein P7V41_002644 [Salmonella enterica]|nr:hypothetical protein A7P63_17585 [Salmonella enterica]MCC1820508.1 hypothetical protein [Salmonella enterica subsp. enterica serovar Indiana]RXY94954.1 hypothetical protein DD607_04530 [Salmonella sp. 3DZ2-4SM]HBC0366162.1 hypothetical protein [Salmonella enterica subsp. enterica]MBM8718959.1 hypothetical protein [Salmonella enterica]